MPISTTTVAIAIGIESTAAHIVRCADTSALRVSILFVGIDGVVVVVKHVTAMDAISAVVSSATANTTLS